MHFHMKMESDLFFVMEISYHALGALEIKNEQNDVLFSHGYGYKIIQLKESDLVKLRERASKRCSSV